MQWVYENIIEFARENICWTQYAKVKRYQIFILRYSVTENLRVFTYMAILLTS